MESLGQKSAFILWHFTRLGITGTVGDSAELGEKPSWCKKMLPQEGSDSPSDSLQMLHLNPEAHGSLLAPRSGDAMVRKRHSPMAPCQFYTVLDMLPVSRMAPFWSQREGRQGGCAQFMALAASSDKCCRRSPQAHETPELPWRGSMLPPAHHQPL